MTLLQRFTLYQRERFPLVVLSLTTASVALSSGVIVASETNALTYVVTFVLGILYLFHIRVIDEIRDAEHDKIFHPTRPVPRGLITLKELIHLSRLGIVIFLVVGFLFGPQTFMIGIAALLYTSIAGKEFFLGEKIRSRFLLYNAVNLVQMVLLQLFVYSLLSHTWYQNPFVYAHLFFVFVNAVFLEVLRKIKTSDEESTGHDTYSWHIGFQTSLVVLMVTAMLSAASCLWIIQQNLFSVPVFILTTFVVFLLTSAVIHGKRKTKKTEGGLLASSLFLYVGLNLIIYFAY